MLYNGAVTSIIIFVVVVWLKVFLFAGLFPTAFHSFLEHGTETELRDLFNELNIMASVGNHPNIVSLIGACSEDGKSRLMSIS